MCGRQNKDRKRGTPGWGDSINKAPRLVWVLWWRKETSALSWWGHLVLWLLPWRVHSILQNYHNKLWKPLYLGRVSDNRQSLNLYTHNLREKQSCWGKDHAMLQRPQNTQQRQGDRNCTPALQVTAARRPLTLEGAQQPAVCWCELSWGAHYTHLSPNLPSRTSLW